VDFCWQPCCGTFVARLSWAVAESRNKLRNQNLNGNLPWSLQQVAKNAERRLDWCLFTFCFVTRQWCAPCFRVVLSVNKSNASCALIMATLCNKAGHYIFALWFFLLLYSSSFFLFFLCLTSAVRDWMSTILLHMVECRSESCCTQLAENAGPKKDRHLGTIAQLCRAVSSQLRHVSTVKKNLLSTNISPTCPYNILNFGLLALVWGTPANFNGFHVLASLLHGTLVLGVSKTLQYWTEGATYIWQGGRHVGHWPTFYLHWMCDVKVKDWVPGKEGPVRAPGRK